MLLAQENYICSFVLMLHDICDTQTVDIQDVNLINVSHETQSREEMLFR